jgi:hypothetical protein
MPAQYTSTSFSPDNLLAGGEALSRGITLLSGQNLLRGAVLGRITLGAAVSAAKSGGNTGNGTLTMDATTPVKNGAKVGVYSVRFVIAATNNGTFIVRDPDGNQIGTVVMAAGAGAFDDDLKFAIADGSTDFAVGDGFDITVAAGSGKYVLSLAAATNGSQVPDLILAEDTDASAADKATVAYHAGQFIESALVLGAGQTADSIREGLRVKGIQLIKGMAIA